MRCIFWDGAALSLTFRVFGVFLTSPFWAAIYCIYFEKRCSYLNKRSFGPLQLAIFYSILGLFVFVVSQKRAQVSVSHYLSI